MRDSELLKKYFEGKLNNQEKHLLEKRALDDPFLQDAMQGFSSVEGSFASFEQNEKLLHKKFSRLYIIIGSLLTVTLVTVLVVLSKKELSENNNLATTILPVQDQQEQVEIQEIIPVAIDTLTEVPEEEQIKAEEVAKNKTEIQKSINYPSNPGQDPILVEESISIKEDFKLESEDIQLQKAELVPATYLHNLFVVDYRRIERERATISYTRFELGGVSAEYENANSQNNSELIEKQVDVPYFEYLDETMDAFANGQFKKALNRYLIILEQYPQDANALFYGGLCYFNLGKYDQAVELFDQIHDMSLNAFKEEAAWYKVKTLVKTGNKTEAKRLLEDIIAGGGFYAEEAILLRKKL